VFTTHRTQQKGEASHKPRADLKGNSFYKNSFHLSQCRNHH